MFRLILERNAANIFAMRSCYASAVCRCDKVLQVLENSLLSRTQLVFCADWSHRDSVKSFRGEVLRKSNTVISCRLGSSGTAFRPALDSSESCQS